MNTVIVPLDGTETSERALPTARFLADALGAHVQLLAVAGSPTIGARLTRCLEHARAQMIDHLDQARVAYDFWTAERIVAAAAPPHAVACMATQWPSGRSIARQVLFHSDGPVVLIGPNAHQPVPTDGTLLTYLDARPEDTELLSTATKWASALALSHTLLLTRAACQSPDVSATAATVVNVDDGSPVRSIVDYEAHHHVALVSWSVPVGWLRRTSRAARTSSRLIRRSESPILAVPRR